MPPKTQVTIDESGNIHIPEHIRKSLDLPPGTKLTIQADITNDTITLRPACENIRIVNKQGVLVLRGAIFNDWLNEEFDEYELLRDQDGEVRALYDSHGEVIDPNKDPIKFHRELRDTKISGRFGYR